ncbi:hypothetical protein [Prauserella muralis]|nr:hypothetical protein [Prauserella muralis]
MDHQDRQAHRHGHLAHPGLAGPAGAPEAALEAAVSQVEDPADVEEW